MSLFYHLGNKEWSAGPPVGYTSFVAAVVALNNDEILMFGGGNLGAALDTSRVFSKATQRWKDTTNACPTGRLWFQTYWHWSQMCYKRKATLYVRLQY